MEHNGQWDGQWESPWVLPGGALPIMASIKPERGVGCGEENNQTVLSCPRHLAFFPPPLQLMESDQCSQREEALTINRDHVILPETRSPPGPELVDTCTRMTSPIFTANLQRQD